MQQGKRRKKYPLDGALELENAFYITANGCWWQFVDYYSLEFLHKFVIGCECLRFYNLSVPPHVCWDETHFGRMASHYLNHTYFMDVHPPLGKMFIAAAGYLTGYDGKFSFKLGEEYDIPNKTVVNFYGMRAFTASLGAITIPLMYVSVLTLSKSEEAAIITSVLLIFDTGFITLSQYILLDPIMIFFMAISVYSIFKFESQNTLHKGKWTCWVFLMLCGVSLGCMLAVKWIGIFTVCFIGILTAIDLWKLLGNTKDVTMKLFSGHFFTRISFLILLPVGVYMASFAVHYKLLHTSGPGDGFHSSAFQSCLQGNELHNSSMAQYLAYGSVISLKHHHIAANGYLHSHDHVYPAEVASNNQQVTLYFHKDVNNLWRIEKPGYNEMKVEDYSKENKRLHNKDIIRLKHVQTGLYLNADTKPAPLTSQQQLVSAINHSSFNNDSDWKLEVVFESEVSDTPNQNIEILSTLLRIVHVKTGCCLHTSMKMLPEWAGWQKEITCTHHRRDRASALWNVEYHLHSYLQKTPLKTCHMTTLQRIIESHLVMIYNNAALKAEERKTSRPWKWPLNAEGQPFTAMRENDLRVYMLGNRFIFRLNLVVIVIFPVTYVILCAFKLRRFNSQSYFPKSFKTQIKTNASHSMLEDFFPSNISACKRFYLAWGLHYFPFYFMSRVLYFHHYFPAFVFSCCLTGSFLDLISKYFSVYFCVFFPLQMPFLNSKFINNALLIILVSCVLQSFYNYSSLCYGFTGPLMSSSAANIHGLNTLDC